MTGKTSDAMKIIRFDLSLAGFGKDSRANP